MYNSQINNYTATTVSRYYLDPICLLCKIYMCYNYTNILATKTTAALNEVALSYHRLRGLYFLAVVFAATIGSGMNKDMT